MRRCNVLIIGGIASIIGIGLFFFEQTEEIAPLITGFGIGLILAGVNRND